MGLVRMYQRMYLWSQCWIGAGAVINQGTPRQMMKIGDDANRVRKCGDQKLSQALYICRSACEEVTVKAVIADWRNATVTTISAALD